MPKAPRPEFRPTLEKLLPFLQRTRTVEVGRDRLWQLRQRLAFLLLTTDISENSKNKFLQEFPCPVFQALTSQEIEQLFGLFGTKALGFHRSPLSTALLKTLSPFRLQKATQSRPAPAAGTTHTQPSDSRPNADWQATSRQD